MSTNAEEIREWVAAAKAIAVREIQCDERCGCVAVYFGSQRNCLDHIWESPNCVFYAHGTYKHGLGWDVSEQDIERARQVATSIREQFSQLVGEVVRQKESTDNPHPA